MPLRSGIFAVSLITGPAQALPLTLPPRRPALRVPCAVSSRTGSALGTSLSPGLVRTSLCSPCGLFRPCLDCSASRLNGVAPSTPNPAPTQWRRVLGVSVGRRGRGAGTWTYTRRVFPRLEGVHGRTTENQADGHTRDRRYGPSTSGIQIWMTAATVTFGVHSIAAVFSPLLENRDQSCDLHHKNHVRPCKIRACHLTTAV